MFGTVPWNKGIERDELTKEKISKTRKERNKEYEKKLLDELGVPNVFCLESCKEKSRNSIMEKFGVPYAMQSPEVKEKSKRNNLQKYGVDHPNKTEENKLRLSLLVKEQRKNEPVVSCPHCGLVGKGPNMKRYHFDSCKRKNEVATLDEFFS
jgi:hypothetical protein